MVMAIVMLIAATRTMNKLAAASGDNVHQSFGLKTINLNLLAACLQFAAFIVWSGGNNFVRYLAWKNKITEEQKICFSMILSSISSVTLLGSYYIIIHVFWHYGINVEQTLIKREKIEEEKRRQMDE